LADEDHQGFAHRAADAHALATLLIGLLLLAGSAFLVAERAAAPVPGFKPGIRKGRWALAPRA
jgi:hypothetical protein